MTDLLTSPTDTQKKTRKETRKGRIFTSSALVFFQICLNSVWAAPTPIGVMGRPALTPRTSPPARSARVPPHLPPNSTRRHSASPEALRTKLAHKKPSPPVVPPSHPVSLICFILKKFVGDVIKAVPENRTDITFRAFLISNVIISHSPFSWHLKCRLAHLFGPIWVYGSLDILWQKYIIHLLCKRYIVDYWNRRCFLYLNVYRWCLLTV